MYYFHNKYAKVHFFFTRVILVSVLFPYAIPLHVIVVFYSCILTVVQGSGTCLN